MATLADELRVIADDWHPDRSGEATVRLAALVVEDASRLMVLERIATALEGINRAVTWAHSPPDLPDEVESDGD